MNSSRIWKASVRDLESREQESLNLKKAFSAVQDKQDNNQYYGAMHQEDYRTQENMQYPLASLARSDLDTMYFDQAMKEPNCKEFLNAAMREVNSHSELKHWDILQHKEVPKRQPLLYLVC